MNSLKPPLYSETKNFAVLKIFINPENEELNELYKSHVKAHNESIQNTPFPNSGFDLIVPDFHIFDKLNKTTMLSMEIKSEMIYYNSITNTIESSPYYMYPRSSLSKTPLMLANHTGIIDSGYRGWLIGAFRCLYFTDEPEQYTLEKHTRLLQICHPSLCPIHVVIVNNEKELTTTQRGEGGFGSTGLVGAISNIESEKSEEKEKTS